MYKQGGKLDHNFFPIDLATYLKYVSGLFKRRKTVFLHWNNEKRQATSTLKKVKYSIF